MNLLIEDNYFEEPDLLRKIALSIDNYRIDNELRFPPNGWRGQRSHCLSELNNDLLNRCESNIFKLCYEYFDLGNFKYKYTFSEYENPESDFMITSYFHITTEETRSAYVDFWQDRFHKDSDTAVAGIVYLNHNPPPNSGTTILDGQNNQFVNIENKYNRLVAYEGYRIHSLSDVFGTCNETGRLTFTFFIHEEEFKDGFN